MSRILHSKFATGRPLRTISVTFAPSWLHVGVAAVRCFAGIVMIQSGLLVKVVEPVMGSDEKDDIRVEDRRHFDREGNPIREGDPAKPAAASEQAEPASPRAEAEKIDFISILFSYVHTAMIYLGDLEDPLQKKTSENLEGARQMIDILELMQQKTRGNLSANETQYLESALYDLRMRYMKKNKLIK